MLYGLIHARYVITNRGMQAMYEKYASASFGRCPRAFCCGQPALPVGRSDLPRNYTVHVFCPMCRDIFTPRSSRSASIDGAYFGTTFPHLFLMTFPELIPQHGVQSFVPRVFGFRIHKASPYHTTASSEYGVPKRRPKASRRSKPNWTSSSKASTGNLGIAQI
jgi:casein kinase II subunit beta|mmetsp:Transcript_2509/g.8445  ORF Transcript_2509/g.8445 Transcript_2509/m.8445 type:complete len:163 (-) Transcript_2509:469-957(-)